MKALLALGLLVSLPALADSVAVSIDNETMINTKLPTVHIHINEPIAGFRLLLTRSDGKKVDIKGGGKPGQTRHLELAQPEGAFDYDGELQVNLPDGSSGSMPMQFQTRVLGPLHLMLEKSDVDVEHRTLAFKLSRPIGKAELFVLMDTGATAMNGEVPFNGEPAGTRLSLSWPEKPGKVMKIALKTFDTTNAFTGIELYPWQIDIPHEEVQFDSGKYDIRPGEAQKLDRSLREIEDAVRKYGAWADIRLFVAGHTDTVGSKDHNRTLSLNRARSIASYFRKNGLRIPVLYEGFGEEALRVGTPDETDEQQNRRADYIISIDEPQRNAPFKPTWRRL